MAVKSCMFQRRKVSIEAVGTHYSGDCCEWEDSASFNIFTRLDIHG